MIPWSRPSRTLTASGCRTTMTSSSLRWMYRLTTSSSSVRASMREVSKLSTTACMLFMSLPGVALSPTNLNRAPAFDTSLTNTALACSPTALWASSSTTHTILLASHLPSSMSLHNVWGVQKNTLFSSHNFFLLSGLVLPLISAVSPSGTPIIL